VTRAATKLAWRDYIGMLGVRFCIGRMKYTIKPGLYAVGDPDPESPVFVSANYKLSFDCLRSACDGLGAWILVLDTKGINVWCAAGKGAFGTEEIVRRIAVTALPKVVSHRTLIVPQLGAPGVAAHEVKKQSGFKVVYGPVRARDIRAFLDAGMKASEQMRRVRFSLVDRLAVIPVELVQWGAYFLLLMGCMFLLSGFNRNGYDITLPIADGSRAVILLLVAFLGGGVLVPLLLPVLPGRAFATKGAFVGVLLLLLADIRVGAPGVDGVGGILDVIAWWFIIPTATSFMAMNYTGTSTYTSLSGVKLEMRYAVPAQLIVGLVGLGLWVAARFL